MAATVPTAAPTPQQSPEPKAKARQPKTKATNAAAKPRKVTPEQTLAAAAGALAKKAGLTSAYGPANAKAFLAFKVKTQTGGLWVNAPGKDGAEHVLNVAKLRTFATKGKADADLAKAIRELCSGTRLYGRKFALLAVASLAQ